MYNSMAEEKVGMCVRFVCKLFEPSLPQWWAHQGLNHQLCGGEGGADHRMPRMLVKPLLSDKRLLYGFTLQTCFHMFSYVLTVLMMFYCCDEQSVYIKQLLAGGETGMAAVSMVENRLLWIFDSGGNFDQLGSILWGFRFLLEVGSNETHRRPWSQGGSFGNAVLCRTGHICHPGWTECVIPPIWYNIMQQHPTNSNNISEAIRETRKRIILRAVALSSMLVAEQLSARWGDWKRREVPGAHSAPCHAEVAKTTFLRTYVVWRCRYCL